MRLIDADDVKKMPFDTYEKEKRRYIELLGSRDVGR